MSQPLVSVVIPVLNGEAYLREAIDSVFAQACDALEVIVLDDGSTDGSAAIAKSYGSKIRYHYQPNLGLGVTAARNRGIELATGQYLAFLDADDIWAKGKLEKQFAAFDQNPGTDMVFGTIQQFYSPELDDEVRSRYRYAAEMIAGYSAGTILISRESFQRVGPFSTDFRVGDFIDWYGKARDLGLKEIMLTDVLLKRRIHADNMGIRDRDRRSDYLHVLKASLERKRAGGSRNRG